MWYDIFKTHNVILFCIINTERILIMQNLDIPMLKQRVYNLMQEKRITQEALASEIGMTQPNFCRAISFKNSQCFTLEQIFKIAQYFDVSVDYLLGNIKPKERSTEREICKLFTDLIEKRTLVKVDYSREEEIYTPTCHDCEITKKQVSYNAFIFPSYLDPGPLDRFDEEQIDNLKYDVLYSGNSDDSNIRINTFFAQYFQIYELFVHNQIGEDLFHEITKKFLDDLK